MHKMLLGIKHLMTGVQLKERPSDVRTDGIQVISSNPAQFIFHQESPSIVCVISDKPFHAYWPCHQSYLQSTEGTIEDEKNYGFIKYGAGEAEWWAQVAGEALRQTYHLPTAAIPGKKQPTDAVLQAMRRKHGALADAFIAALRWEALNRCWFYELRGMLLEVEEEDGYIHS